jgi:hypothetical protein
MRSLANFTELFFFCAIGKEKTNIGNLFLFSYRAGPANPTQPARIRNRAPTGPTWQSLPPSFPNPPSHCRARAPLHANIGRAVLHCAKPPRALVRCSTHKPACARLSTSASPVACAALGRLCHGCATPLVSCRCVLPDKPVLTSLLPHLTDPLAQLVPASTAACLAQSLASPATMVDPACVPKPPLAVLTKP